MTPKLRVSYSLISAWLEGNTDRAVDLYFHVDKIKSKAMSDGLDIHDQISRHVEKHKRLPEFMPQFSLKHPQCETYHKVEYNELFDLSAKFDMLDSPILGEWKTGISDSLEWSRTIQLPFYFLVAELAGIEIEKAYLAHFNQHNRTNDWLMVWNNETARNMARNMIDSVAPEIDQFFRQQGLL